MRRIRLPSSSFNAFAGAPVENTENQQFTTAPVVRAVNTTYAGSVIYIAIALVVALAGLIAQRGYARRRNITREDVMRSRRGRGDL